MDKVLEFLKSLVMPRKMIRYRYMSVLISIIIFLLCLQVVTLPFSYTNNKTLGEKKELYNYQALLEIEASLSEVNETSEQNVDKLEKLAGLGCSVVDSILSCDNLDVDNDPTEVDYHEQIVFTTAGITKKIDIVVLTFKDDLSEDDNKKLDENITEILNDFNKIDYVENEEIYLVMLLPQYIFFQPFQESVNGKNLKHNDNLLISRRDTYDYKTFVPTLDLNLNDQQARSIGEVIVDKLAVAQIEAENIMIGAQLFFTFFLPSLLFIFLFWLVFRKNGKLVTFKEYYNIAAISSIVITILVFSIGWFWSGIFSYYLFIFMGYYLFVLYKINSSPDEVS